MAVPNEAKIPSPEDPFQPSLTDPRRQAYDTLREMQRRIDREYGWRHWSEVRRSRPRRQSRRERVGAFIKAHRWLEAAIYVAILLGAAIIVWGPFLREWTPGSY